MTEFFKFILDDLVNFLGAGLFLTWITLLIMMIIVAVGSIKK